MSVSLKKYLRVSLLAGLSSFVLVFAMVMPVGAVDGSGGSAIGGSIPAGQKIRGDLASREGEVTVFVQFAGQGAFAATQSDEVKQGLSSPADERAAVQSIRGGVERIGESVTRQASGTLLYTTSNTLPGAAIKGDAGTIRELASRADVVKITPIIPDTIPENPSNQNGQGRSGQSGDSQVPANKNTNRNTRVLDAWAQKRQTGEGVKIAVIDSGVDYTHSAFGGPGTAEAYEEAKASPDMVPGTFDPQKLLGGYDLAGDDYDGANFPQPDNNPLDCAPPADAQKPVGGHGTHVAGIAAGYGTNADGSTFRAGQDGNPAYADLTPEQLDGMGIGPGSAPDAGIYAFRVFGCTGSTSLSMEALDRVLDPNEDGNFQDRVDIVNLSLTVRNALVDNPRNDIINELTSSGVLDVAAPATDIVSVGVGSGNGPLTKSGTSMAAPHVAGIAALVQAQTRQPPLVVKSIVMNTASGDVYRNGAVYGPGRVGAGRVDALGAISTNIYAYATKDLELTSLNFGGVTRLRLARYLPTTTIPGVEYVIGDGVWVEGRSSQTFNVTLRIDDPVVLRKTMDPTMDAEQEGMARQFIAEASGRIELYDANSPDTLRVPVHAAPKPTSDVRVGQELNFGSGTQARFSLTGRQLAQGGNGPDAYNNLVAPWS